MFDILGNATANAAWATGNVQQYYKYVATIGSLVFPLSLIAFTCGMPPAAAYVIFIVIYILLIFVKLYIIKGLLAFPSIMFFREVLSRIFPVTLLSFILPGIFYWTMEESIMRFLLVSVVGVLSTLGCICYWGLEVSEKQVVADKIISMVRKM